jgi:DHA1 family tetracycline resistance protein-like MFS transporter
LGVVLGPALGGLLGATDPRLPFLVAAVLTLLNACYGLFVLPESLPRDRRAAFDWTRANPVGALGLLRRYPGLPALMAVLFLYWLAHQVLASVFVLYAGHRYGWGPREVGLTLAFVGVCTAVVQGGLVRPIVRRFGERRTLLAGLLFGSAGFTLYALAPTGLAFVLTVPIFAPMGLFTPSYQSLATRRVASTEQGRLQGANSSTLGLTGMIGPALFTQVFAYAIEPHGGPGTPGLPFLLAGGLLVAALALAWRATAADAAAEPDTAAEVVR